MMKCEKKNMVKHLEKALQIMETAEKILVNDENDTYDEKN